ncbi:MAG: FecR domain-containing protein [Spirochaetales bacterium]|nr:FecR domain-containing protein [Spirochaetales bacterium]
MKSGNVTVKILSYLMILSTFGLYGQEAGYIEYLSGMVNVQHKGEVSELLPEDIGYSVFEYDLISTGSDGLVELALDGVGSSGTKLTIHENTVFTVESGGRREYPDTRLKILKGSIGLRVTKLLHGSSLSVQTETASMGVRGTSFNIATGPDGSVLVVCSEGKVSCTGYKGDEYFAEPGTGVEKLPADDMGTIAVEKGTEEAYMASWVATRKEVFKSGAPIFVKAYWNQWKNIRGLYNSAYEKLIQKSALMQQYGLKALESGFQTTGDMVKVKTEVSAEVIEIRKFFSLYEQVFYRLSELEEYHRNGIGVVQLDKKTSSEAFFTDFRRKYDDYLRELAVTRYLMRMYLYINRAAGSLGHEGLIEDFFSDDPFGEGKPSGNPF